MLEDISSMSKLENMPDIKFEIIYLLNVAFSNLKFVTLKNNCIMIIFSFSFLLPILLPCQATCSKFHDLFIVYFYCFTHTDTYTLTHNIEIQPVESF